MANCNHNRKCNGMWWYGVSNYIYRSRRYSTLYFYIYIKWRCGNNHYNYQRK